MYCTLCTPLMLQETYFYKSWNWIPYFSHHYVLHQTLYEAEWAVCMFQSLFGRAINSFFELGYSSNTKYFNAVIIGWLLSVVTPPGSKILNLKFASSLWRISSVWVDFSSDIQSPPSLNWHLQVPCWKYHTYQLSFFLHNLEWGWRKPSCIA